MNQPSILSKDGFFLSVDSSLPSCLGIDQEDLVGLHIREAFPAEIALEIADLFREHSILNKPFLASMMISGRWIMLLCKPLDTKKDESVKFIVIHATSWASWNECIRDVCIHTIRHLDLGPLGSLTRRELEVFALIGRGFTTEQIASYLHRSKRTVQGHRVSLGRKLGVKTRGEITRLAAEAGLNDLNLEDLPILTSDPVARPGAFSTCSGHQRRPIRPEYN